MHTNSPAGGRQERHRDKSALRRVRDTARASRPALRRMRAVGYLALLLAVPLAATGIAMGRAGMPAPFSTACGVVSCAAGGQAP
jgi:hypothetical protein